MVSICMATYNGERFLRKQLDSILVQLEERDELIASDDGSTDSTSEILREYAAKDPRIKFVNGPHKGVIANFSYAISLAKGDIIFLSDQDDVWRPNKVVRVRQVIDAQKGCGVVVHNARLVGSDGKSLNQTLFKFRNSRKGFGKNIWKNSYVGCCMAFQSSLIPYILPIPRYVEMHDWWIGLISELFARPIFIKDELIDYRRHESNASAMHRHSVPRMFLNRGILLVSVTARLLTSKGCLR